MINEKMWANARKAQESLYTDTCNVYELAFIKDPITHMTNPGDDILVIEKQPCRLSFKTFPSTNHEIEGNTLIQSIKLFIAPEIEIKAGSQIEIIRNGITKRYKRSGEPALYKTHQEVNLELAKEWA